MPTLKLLETERDEGDQASSPPGVEPALYIALEGARPLSGGLRASLAGVREVRFERGALRSFSTDRAGSATVVVPDPRMSTKHARLALTADGILLEDLGSTNGSFLGGRRIDRAVLDDGAVFVLGATAFVVRAAETVPPGSAAVCDSDEEADLPSGLKTLVPSLAAALDRLTRVVASKLPILLLGESGVGKEVLASTAHRLSRRAGPFVAINCGALAPSLLESQLFGHTRGAFSGAVRDEPGLIRSSTGGTLFLDEIGELPGPAQATLLRVLQEAEVLPVGGSRPLPVDLRVIAATHKRIDQSPSFRLDLYARIAGYTHAVPPLRERRGDIGILIADLLARVAPDRAASLRIAPDLGAALVAHAWPMNVRQLERALEVAVVTSSDNVLRLEHVGDALAASPAARPIEPMERASLAESAPESARERSEEDTRLRADLVSALERAGGNVSEVAREMGRTRMQIHRWMKRFGVDPSAFRR